MSLNGSISDEQRPSSSNDEHIHYSFIVCHFRNIFIPCPTYTPILISYNLHHQGRFDVAGSVTTIPLLLSLIWINLVMASFIPRWYHSHNLGWLQQSSTGFKSIVSAPYFWTLRYDKWATLQLWKLCWRTFYCKDFFHNVRWKTEDIPRIQFFT